MSAVSTRGPDRGRLNGRAWGDVRYGSCALRVMFTAELLCIVRAVLNLVRVGLGDSICG